MPSVSSTQAPVVQGRIHRAHATSRRPPIRAAIEKAKGTEKPTYPMYSSGGWNTMPGSCSRGFKSLPSAAGGKILRNGFEVITMKAMMPKSTSPITESTRAIVSSGRRRPSTATMPPHHESVSAQNRIEPSWLPQAAATL